MRRNGIAQRGQGRLLETRASAALTTITLLALEQPIIEIAGELEPAELRSLDALHPRHHPQHRGRY